jgi:hypothetical protein
MCNQADIPLYKFFHSGIVFVFKTSLTNKSEANITKRDGSTKEMMEK